MPHRALRTATAGFLIVAVGACSGSDESTGVTPDDLDLPAGVEYAPLDASLEVIADGFEIPWAVEVLDDDEYLVSERTGGLFHVLDGEAVELDGIPRSEAVEIDPLVYGGVNDVSLHPDFDRNGLVYLAYVNTSFRMVVGRFDFSERIVDDFEVIFETTAFSIGSRIAWPDDDHFLVTHGVGGSPRPDPGPQDPDSDLGKTHRLLADGSIPDDNPVFDEAVGPTSVWTYGQRDPQGLFVDDDGVVYANEHGPLGGDELNVLERGGNYGWPLTSAGLNYDNTPVGEPTAEDAAAETVLPLKTWGPEFNMAPSGLTRLDDSAFPEWDGAFVWGALAQRRLIAYDVESDTTAVLLDDVGRIRDIAQLPDGTLLALIDAIGGDEGDTGRVVRIAPR